MPDLDGASISISPDGTIDALIQPAPVARQLFDDAQNRLR